MTYSVSIFSAVPLEAKLTEVAVVAFRKAAEHSLSDDGFRLWNDWRIGGADPTNEPSASEIIVAGDWGKAFSAGSNAGLKCIPENADAYFEVKHA